MNKKLILAALLLLGCGATQQQLVDRAAYDLQCPKEQLQVHQIDNRTQGVRGCGQQVAYVESCDGQRTNCSWVLNADSRPSQKQSACVPNETKACLGPGACKGAQACRADGAGYTACDCG